MFLPEDVLIGNRAAIQCDLFAGQLRFGEVVRNVNLHNGHGRTDWQHLIDRMSFFNSTYAAPRLKVIWHFMVELGRKVIAGESPDEDSRRTFSKIDSVEAVEHLFRSNELNIYVSPFRIHQILSALIRQFSRSFCSLGASAEKDSLPEEKADSDASANNSDNSGSQVPAIKCVICRVIGIVWVGLCFFLCFYKIPRAENWRGFVGFGMLAFVSFLLGLFFLDCDWLRFGVLRILKSVLS